MTGFGKTCTIVHTSDFAHLKMHKIYKECYKGLKFSEIVASSTVPLSYHMYLLLFLGVSVSHQS